MNNAVGFAGRALPDIFFAEGEARPTRLMLYRIA